MGRKKGCNFAIRATPSMGTEKHIPKKREVPKIIDSNMWMLHVFALCFFFIFSLNSGKEFQ